MLDLGLRSFQGLTLEELITMLVGMALCIGVVLLIGFDVIVIGIVIRFAIPLFAELTRRAWIRVKARLCTARPAP